jgi:purine-binding chemotaxis protein CheW
MDRQLQLLVFLLDERYYALHLSQVRRVVRAVDVVPLPNAPDIVLGAIDLHGTVVPLFNIRRRFRIIDREITPEDEFVIACTSQRTVALAADKVTDIIQRPAEQLVAAKTILDPLQLVEGVIQLEEGLVLIHDLDRFLSLDEERVLETALTRQLKDASHGT